MLPNNSLSLSQWSFVGIKQLKIELFPMVTVGVSLFTIVTGSSAITPSNGSHIAYVRLYEVVVTHNGINSDSYLVPTAAVKYYSSTYDDSHHK